MNPEILWHYTKSLDSLVSILENGFYYSFCPTRVFDQLFKDAEIDAMEPDDKAMVCFTEIESKEMRDKFGLYGICISIDWAIANGAKKVTYIGRQTPEYKKLLERLISSAPKRPFGYNPMEQNNIPMLEKTLRQLTLGHTASTKFFGAKEDYGSLLREIQFMQIEAHSSQKEWRIRNPNSFSGIQKRNSDMDLKFGRIHQVKEDKNYFMEIFKSNPELQKMMFLKIYPPYLLHLVLPKEDEIILKSKINLELYKNLELIFT